MKNKTIAAQISNNNVLAWSEISGNYWMVSPEYSSPLHWSQLFESRAEYTVVNGMFIL